MTGGLRDTLASILEEIDTIEPGETTVFIIGRYNNLKPRDLHRLQQIHPHLTIHYTTAHSAKGLEADYVILIGLRGGIYGFPCQITDDPLLNVVLAKEDRYPNAEERRLFYVAITRAKKHVYLITDIFKPSPFITEIQQKGYEINIREKRIPCPLCTVGTLVLRKSMYGDFYSCSNYPYCEYRKES